LVVVRGRFYKYAAPMALKNPEGISSSSPALTRSGYAGKRITK
jgi:hypothetical protein